MSDMIEIEILRAKGSTPRDAGTRMHVGPDWISGSIGGGQLEFRAMELARGMLHAGGDDREMDLPLGPEIGQCCGGHVRLRLRHVAQIAPSDAPNLPHLYVFGAGHVGRALSLLINGLAVLPHVVDERSDLIAALPGSVKAIETALPEAIIRDAPSGAAFVITTHDHGLDFALADAALARGDAAYVGMIGSATKRARFESWQRNHGQGQGQGQRQAQNLICPIGAAGRGDKRPEAIAIHTISEILIAFAGGEG